MGLSHQQVLGSGMEGTVVSLGDGTVAKVWSGRALADLVVLRDFYEAVAERRPDSSTVALPRIVDVRDVDGTPVTIERYLPGEPLWEADGSSPTLTTTHIDSLVEALAALADIPGDPALRTLRMLHHSAWLARRWEDPLFPTTFPWFNTTRYWGEQIIHLREQLGALTEPALAMP